MLFRFLTNPSMAPVEENDENYWPWALAILILIGGGAWLFLRNRGNRRFDSDQRQDIDPSIPMLLISHMKKSYGKLDVLRDITTEVHRGEVISIIGPSGTGKSTFLRCLNRLEEPSGGRIEINGIDILDRKADVNLLRRKMGMVFQNFNLFHHLTVLDNITLCPRTLMGKSRLEAETRAMELLQLVGLYDKAGSLPSELSGGQKQRAAIARCLAMDPEIILFDEPTSADRKSVV